MLDGSDVKAMPGFIPTNGAHQKKKKNLDIHRILKNFREPETSNLEDLLFLLSPHILSKPTQYLLQYLVSKLKIHKKHPETLFFVALPYNSYAIFGKIVECLPIRETTR